MYVNGKILYVYNMLFISHRTSIHLYTCTVSICCAVFRYILFVLVLVNAHKSSKMLIN